MANINNNNNNNNILNSNTLNYKIATIKLNNISNNNKINALKTFVRLMDFDIILFQEIENNELVLNGYEIEYNIDERKRVTAIALK
jgi:hypothetical protein